MDANIHRENSQDLFAGETVEADGLAPVRHAEDVVALLLRRVPRQAPDTARLYNKGFRSGCFGQIRG